MTPRYAVIITYSFDDETPVVLFENREEAVEFIRKTSKREYDIDVNENGWGEITEYSIDPDGEHARIINHFSDHDDITDWSIGTTYDVSGWKEEEWYVSQT
jgi:hypothetical protein